MWACVFFAGDKPFSCDICQKKFALGCNLRAHLRTHEAEYQSSPASLELYRRTLEMLAAQDANDGSAKEDNSNSSSPTRESHDEEEEELDMEDVEEDDVATSSSPPKEAAAAATAAAAAAAGQLIQDLPKLAAAVQAV